MYENNLHGTNPAELDKCLCAHSKFLISKYSHDFLFFMTVFLE